MLRPIIRTLAISLVAAPLAFTSADAQGRGNGRAVPPGHLPSAGECRVWYDNLPPGRQPAPTSCRQAERVAAQSRNARVVYGGDRRADERYDRDDRRDRDDRGSIWDRDRRDDRDSRIDRRDDRRDGRFDVRDGRYDVRDRRTLPRMPRVSELRGNRIPSGLQRQVRGSAQRARYEDRNRDGRPERVVFLDRRGQALETWYDLRGDGRADRIVVHRN